MKWVNLFSMTVAGLLVSAYPSASATAAEDSERLLVVELSRQVHFEGLDEPIEPGVYRVRQSEFGFLQLTPEGGEPVRLPVIFGTHGEDVVAPTVFSAETGEDEFRLLVLLPGGSTMEAIASYSGVQARGSSRRMKRSALSRAQVSSRFLRYKKFAPRDRLVAYASGRRLQARAQSGLPRSSSQPASLKPDLGFTPCDVRFRWNGCAGGAGRFDVDTKLKNFGPTAATLESGRKYVIWDKGEAIEGSYWAKYGPDGGRLLQPDEEVSVTNYVCTVAETPLGDHFYTFQADPDGRIDESNEQNNLKTCKYTVTEDTRPAPPPRVDVEISSVSVTPTIGTSQTLFSYQTTIRNVGDLVVNDARISCSTTGSESVGALAPNQSATRTLEAVYYMPPGEKTVTCTASSLGQVDTNSANDSKAASFTVQ